MSEIMLWNGLKGEVEKFQANEKDAQYMATLHKKLENDIIYFFTEDQGAPEFETVVAESLCNHSAAGILNKERFHCVLGRNHEGPHCDGRVYFTILNDVPPSRNCAFTARSFLSDELLVCERVSGHPALHRDGEWLFTANGNRIKAHGE